jgi:hypothetical protein
MGEDEEWCLVRSKKDKQK